MELRPVPLTEKPRYWQLMQVYQRELSAHSGLTPNSQGEYPYVYFELYWQETDRRFPYQIMENGQVAGLLLLRYITTDDLGRFTRALQIAEIFVLPEFRGTGLAGQVVDEVARRAQGDRRRVTWSCYISNVRALGLYDKVIKAFETQPGWRVEKKPFVDACRKARFFYSLVPKFDK